jgi:hypothetical protein
MARHADWSAKGRGRAGEVGACSPGGSHPPPPALHPRLEAGGTERRGLLPPGLHAPTSPARPHPFARELAGVQREGAHPSPFPRSLSLRSRRRKGGTSRPDLFYAPLPPCARAGRGAEREVARPFSFPHGLSFACHARTQTGDPRASDGSARGVAHLSCAPSHPRRPSPSHAPCAYAPPGRVPLELCAANEGEASKVGQEGGATTGRVRPLATSPTR